jgi:hypothetical protein
VVATHDPLVVEQADETLALGAYSTQDSASPPEPGRRPRSAESAASSSDE